MFFDLKKDLSETQDLIKQPKYAGLINHMQRALQAANQLKEPPALYQQQSLPKLKVVLSLSGPKLTPKVKKQISSYLKKKFRDHLMETLRSCTDKSLKESQLTARKKPPGSNKNYIIVYEFTGLVSYQGSAKSAIITECAIKAFSDPSKFASFHQKILAGQKSRASLIKALKVFQGKKLLQQWHK